MKQDIDYAPYAPDGELFRDSPVPRLSRRHYDGRRLNTKRVIYDVAVKYETVTVDGAYILRVVPGKFAGGRKGGEEPTRFMSRELHRAERNAWRTTLKRCASAGAREDYDPCRRDDHRISVKASKLNCNGN